MSGSEVDQQELTRPGTLKLLWGMVRRYYLTHFRKGYVEKQKELRRGECQRCGECCKIVFDCPWLEDDNQCTVYEDRALQCRAFPIDERDLQDVPECAYSFATETEAAETAEKPS